MLVPCESSEGSAGKVLRMSEKRMFVMGAVCALACSIAVFASAEAAADGSGIPPSIVPAPQQVEWRDGTYRGTNVVDVFDAALPKAGYELTVDASGIRVASSDGDGAFYARMTLRQLAQGVGEQVSYPFCRIRDWPRFRWRGCLVDEGRHFFGKETIKKIIEAMAFNKLNVLHWHLTEDQGWRIEIRKWPELTARGSVRAESPRFDNSAEGDGRQYGPYFYTEKEIEEIVEFAERHHVKIVPELEIPGHSRAALTAYPEFSCLGERLERRVDVKWGVKRELYCAGNDRAIAFLESVLDEYCRLFKHSEFIHIGGDECPKIRWRRCPKCQARIKSAGLKDENALQTWLMRHFAEYLMKKGRRAIGWEEMLDGGICGNTAVMCWLGTEKAAFAATNGVDCVVCPNRLTYLDQKQGIPDDPWRSDGGGLPLSRVYSFDPTDGVPGEFAGHVLGSEGLLWSEGIRVPEELMWQGFPRLCAVAEIMWSEKSVRDYGDFVRRLGDHIPRLRRMGVNAAPTPEGVPASRAMQPAENGRAVGYDWRERHDYILAEAKTWRTNPNVVFIGDDALHLWSGVDSIGETDDSLTLPRWKSLFGRSVRVMNMSCAGDRTENALWRVDNGELKNVRTKLVVVMLGRNNLVPDEDGLSDSPEETAQAIRGLVGRIRRIQPQTRILLLGVLPAGTPGSPLRRNVDRLNALLARIPSYGYDGKVSFEDAGGRFVDANGDIVRGMMSDSVHPTDAGYKALSAIFLKHIELAVSN